MWHNKSLAQVQCCYRLAVLNLREVTEHQSLAPQVLSPSANYPPYVSRKRANERGVRPGFCFQEAHVHYFWWDKTKLQSKIQTQAFTPSVMLSFQVTRRAVTKSQNVVCQKIKIHDENILLVGRHLRALNVFEVGKIFKQIQFHFCYLIKLWKSCMNLCWNEIYADRRILNQFM